MDAVCAQIDLMKTNIQFESVCEQILFLNQRMQYLETRYARASRVRNKSALYSLRLQLSTLESVRNVFVEMATRKADRLVSLECELFLREENIQ